MWRKSFIQRSSPDSNPVMNQLRLDPRQPSNHALGPGQMTAHYARHATPQCRRGVLCPTHDPQGRQSSLRSPVEDSVPLLPLWVYSGSSLTLTYSTTLESSQVCQGVHSPMPPWPPSGRMHAHSPRSTSQSCDRCSMQSRANRSLVNSSITAGGLCGQDPPVRHCWQINSTRGSSKAAHSRTCPQDAGSCSTQRTSAKESSSASTQTSSGTMSTALFRQREPGSGWRRPLQHPRPFLATSRHSS